MGTLTKGQLRQTMGTHCPIERTRGSSIKCPTTLVKYVPRVQCPGGTTLGGGGGHVIL